VRKLILSAAIAAMTVSAVPALADRHDHNDRHDNGRHNGWNDNDRGRDWQRGRSYDWNRPDPRYGSYDPARYYRQGNYSERRLGRNDRVYRGGDGRYYCRRTDGTTGLIVGGVLGGLLGNTIADGHSSTLATILGASGGALLGKSIDKGNVRCR
jgi:Ni/Co efflux regulator RcnB